MDRIDELRVFVRVVECSSFTQAAASLQLPRSTVSTAVLDLEARVGRRLLHRTTRRVAPTQDGQAFYQRSVQIIGDYEEAASLFRQAGSELRGTLKVNVPGRMGRLIIAPALPGFLDLYPDISIDLGVTDRAVDLIQEGIDCVIRVGPLSDSSLIQRPLGELQLCNCASPAYLERYGVPRAVVDLADHFAVAYASPSNGRTEPWEYVEAGEERTAALRSRVTVNGAEAYIASCLAGLGLIQIPAYDVIDHLDAGELVEVLPGHRASPMPMALLYPHRRHLSRRLQVFADWISDLFEAEVLARQRSWLAARGPHARG